MVNASIHLEDGALICRTSYDAALVAALKAAIGAEDRRWDPSRKAWLVAPRHGALVQGLIAKHLGLHVGIQGGMFGSKDDDVPALQVLELRYIGTCKDRGSGERSAFGWVGGGWNAVFPETTLQTFFGVEPTPQAAITLYAVLGLGQLTDDNEIKPAYRRMALQWHPDRCKEPGASEQFIRIQHAYEVLSNATTRARYDAGLYLERQTVPQVRESDQFGFRPPLRCGHLLVEARALLGRVAVERILSWQDITNASGQTLVVSWPSGAEHFEEDWI